MDKILNIMRRLRRPGGCPWDRKQTLRSLKRCVLEEAHEVVDAIDSRKRRLVQEEIGDLLCSIALLIAVGEEKRFLDKKEIINGAVKKMISRHPHVFGGEKARTADQALRFFQKVKEKERKQKKESLFADMGRSLPALMAAEKIQRKVARVGFDWPNAKGVLAKLDEELTEVKQALKSGRKPKIREEVGDFLFTAVNLARKTGVDSEMALLEANRKFKKRFHLVEKLARKQGLDFHGKTLPPATLDKLWNKAKRKA